MTKIMLGTWCEIPTTYTTHVIAKAGLDFMIFDMEHGVMDFELIQNMVFTAHSEHKLAFVRIPEISETYVTRILDMGVDGLVFPHVKGIADVTDIVKLSKFFPVGERGFNPYIAAGGYRPVDDSYFDQQNQRIKIVVILEGIEAFNNIEEILLNDYIDIVYIGQYDLSLSIGVAGDIYNEKITKIMNESVEKINNYGKIAGCMVHSSIEAKKVIDKGFGFIVYKVDTGILYNAINCFVSEVNDNETF